MARTTPLLVLMLLAPALAGCFAEDAPAAAADAVPAASAAEAGAQVGPAPAAPTEAYTLQAGEAGAETVVVHPVPFPTNPPKPPYVQQFTGQFEPYQCTPTGGGLPLGGLGLAEGGQRFDIPEAFATGDVFSYDVTMRFTNTDQSWAELHLWHVFDSVRNYWREPTSDTRGEVVLNFTGQGYIVNEEFLAAVGVDCWYGSVTSPIAFTIDVAITFAEGAVPSQVPVLVEVPEGAKRLFVSGLAVDPLAPVTAHYRVFAPDDSLVCECALNSAETTSIVELPSAGEHVILIDHAEGGFVSFGLDAPPAAPVRALQTRWEEFPLAGSDGGPVDETLQIDLPSTPLGMGAWVFAPGDIRGPPDVGGGHNVKIGVTNARGEVIRMSFVGYFTFHAAVEGIMVTNDWFGVPIDGDWEFYIDHHAFSLGAHTVTVQAEQMRGEARMFAVFYDRASA